MVIWIINQHNMPPKYGHLNRHFYIAKYLQQLGHKPFVFVGSYLHNTNIQMISSKEKYKFYDKVDFPYVFVKTCNYKGSKIKRLWSMLQFYFRIFKIVKKFKRPDVIIGSSPHPLVPVAAIKLSRKYKCQSIVEIRDLWPESFIAYGIWSKKNILIRILYCLEKWIYKKANKIIFTMEGGKDYIINKKWDDKNRGPIDIGKVYHINNGVDLQTFDYNKDNYVIDDKDLKENDYFKVVYTGSLRKANNSIMILLNCAKLMQIKYPKVIFLIYGEGTEKEKCIRYCNDNNINNVIFKGFVEKKYIPYILSKCDLNILNCSSNGALKYGGSQNKLFEYLASGHPIT